MDLKAKIQEISPSIKVRKFDFRLIVILGVLGVIIIALSLWLAISDWRAAGVTEKKQQEAQNAVNLL